MNQLKRVKLGDVAKVISGYAFKSEDFMQAGIPVIKIANIKNGAVLFDEGNTEYLPSEIVGSINENFIVKYGDILVSLTGSHMTQPNSVVGRVAQYKFKTACLLNQRAGKVKITDEKAISNGFLYYLLSTNAVRQEIALLAHGAANQANVSPKDIEKLKFNIPFIKAQEKIAAILSAYDDLIENNQRRITLLERLAEEVYREWFVRLRFPGHAQATFEKGVPVGWEVELASKYFGVVKGKSYSGDEVSDVPGHIPFINLKSFNRGGGYRSDGLKYYSGRFHENQMVYRNDVVMAVTDMTQNREVVGRVARLPQLGERGAVISLDVVKLVPNLISKTFLYSYLRYSGFGNFIKEFANGANVLHLSPDMITKQKIVMPPHKLRERIDEIVIPIYDKIDLMNEATARLVESRDKLIPRLISGKLPVEALAIQFPPSMREEEGRGPTTTVETSGSAA